MSTETLGSLTLRERAAAARDEAQRKEEEQNEGRYQKERKSLTQLIEKVLGVEPEGITFRRRNEWGGAVAEIDGLSFALTHDDYMGRLQFLSPCDLCGAERQSAISSVKALGDLLASPAKFYHSCPRPVDQDSTPEGRLLTALRDLIAENVPEVRQ